MPPLTAALWEMFTDILAWLVSYVKTSAGLFQTAVTSRGEVM